MAFADPGNHVHVGFEPDGQPFFGLDPTDLRRYAVGMRVGEQALRATQGLWLAERSLFIATGTQALPNTATPSTMSRDYPGVVYAS